VWLDYSPKCVVRLQSKVCG